MIKCKTLQLLLKIYIEKGCKISAEYKNAAILESENLINVTKEQDHVYSAKISERGLAYLTYISSMSFPHPVEKTVYVDGNGSVINPDELYNFDE